ncbi:dimethylnonatriene synthase-like [Panicum virgatum]|uniref:Uncharacterized protein n=1 Tax=Panicum virgatum TaxID=38727 RepID=A0A8T0VUX7_PANVG|nr:dimethylnonatriene synthase-like [Panicum virgatum]KAG2635269.1 hypothetical protein PVAP13_2NG341200 [Panicum virgatum]
MELSPWAALFAVVLATALFLKAIPSRGRRRAYNLPPGPKPWPIIGNLNLLGELPHRSTSELSRRYGPLMQLWFGSMPVVVGSSAEMARFFLKTHDAAFCDRPRFAVGKHTTYDYSDILWAPYGAYLRQARKICAAELFSAKRVGSLEYIRDQEVRALLRGVRGAASGGRAVRLRDHLQMAALGGISRMVLSNKYVETDDGAEGGAPPAATPAEFRELVDEFFALNSAFNIGDYVPWLERLDLQGFVRRMKKMSRRFDRFLEHVLDVHNERRQLEGDRFVARDMVDVLLQRADDPNLEVPMSRDNVKALVQDLLIGGTDTSWMTIEWAVSELLRNPDLLAKATMELDRVVGDDRDDRLVRENDLPNLPYIDWIIKETLRVHPAAPMLTPRLAREDASAGGYDIPAGTTVLVNAWAIARDPALWDAAEEFRPERFAGSKIAAGETDFKFKMLPFGSGRRMCPAFSLGLRVIALSLANLLHGFAWRLPDGMDKEDLSMEETYQLVLPRKVPLEAIVEPKLPALLYAGA